MCLTYIKFFRQVLTYSLRLFPMDDGLKAETGGPNYTVRFGAALFVAAVVMAAAGHFGGVLGLLAGGIVVGGTGTVLGRRIDSEHETLVSSVEAVIDEPDPAVTDGGIRELAPRYPRYVQRAPGRAGDGSAVTD